MALEVNTSQVSTDFESSLAAALSAVGGTGKQQDKSEEATMLVQKSCKKQGKIRGHLGGTSGGTTTPKAINFQIQTTIPVYFLTDVDMLF